MQGDLAATLERFFLTDHRERLEVLLSLLSFFVYFDSAIFAFFGVLVVLELHLFLILNWARLAILIDVALQPKIS